ncbi:MAG: class I SAM-dependent methyltransferase [Methanolinea sp.]|nr:class I SAM-dependent methyltransferase [Methanolinea sp.]
MRARLVTGSVEDPYRDPYREAWEEEYARKGRIYGRVTRDLPWPGPGTRVLDVGCGDCRGLHCLGGPELRKYFACYVGIDHARAALRSCRKISSRAPGVHVVLGNGMRLPFRDGSFDMVFLVHVLGHVLLADRMRMAREAARVARMGGEVFVRVFSLSDFRAGRGEEVEEGTRVRGTGIPTHFFSRDEICDLFPDLSPVTLREVSWMMGVGKGQRKRAEIEGLFARSP